MRLRNIKDADTKLEDFKEVVVIDPSNLSNEFKKNQELHLEIGMGKGRFIKRLARENPNINYLGLEKSTSMTLRAARSLSKEAQDNLKILVYDAINLEEIFASGSVNKIYLNFSDPWPKTRHAKRRLTSDDFLKVYKNILADNGVIELKTDNKILFEFSVLKFNEFGFKFLDINLDLHLEEDPSIVTTEYEEKFKKMKKNIYFIKVEKWALKKEWRFMKI